MPTATGRTRHACARSTPFLARNSADEDASNRNAGSSTLPPSIRSMRAQTMMPSLISPCETKPPISRKQLARSHK